MTVLDTSGAVDVLLGSGAAATVNDLLARQGPLAAPDVLTFEVLAVLRRMASRGDAGPERLGGAVADLGDLSLQLYPAIPLRARAWGLRENFTAGDALFVALAEALDEPLATKDLGLADATERHTGVQVVRLG
ncbi:type II toxin-antitoxin system VapC family toxin [Patulibacter sp.]|uniref:type II toxin-antitoxin system VapC family toxin n=1 Tax=Patulibacter sp. TaxID=1912859 RepID=UPI002722FAF6|nr:type II toxin-antitoxin system VapC family toxin [Patulibacter sp.]MDO9408183.1 type II toxin-antitoxin system VapC family toxin [Patulibacter sp.]